MDNIIFTDKVCILQDWDRKRFFRIQSHE